MRVFWCIFSVASALAVCGTLNAAQAPAPTPNLPNVPEVYKFVPGWPKPLPNGWSMGTVTGLFVDPDDNVWVLNRGEDEGKSAKTPAPAVLEFDSNGNLLRSWGTPASAPAGVWP